MRYLLFLCCCFSFSTSCHSQSKLENDEFIDWIKFSEVVISGVSYPEFWEPRPGNFWTTSNQGTRTISFAPTCLRTEDAIDNTAVLLRSATFPFGIAAGSLVSGTYLGGTDPAKAIKSGRPWTGKPERFVGYYKYLPKNGDYCIIDAILTKWNGSSSDTIGRAQIPASDVSKTVSTYTKFDFPFNYNYANKGEPDSIRIVFTASGNGINFKGGNGTELYLDHIKLLYPGETGLPELEENNLLRIFPNPASHTVFIRLKEIKKEVEFSIYNSAGSLVLSETIVDSFNPIDISNLSSGLYFYRATQKGLKEIQGKILIEQ